MSMTRASIPPGRTSPRLRPPDRWLTQWKAVAECGVEGGRRKRDVLEAPEVKADRIAGPAAGERDHVRSRVDRVDHEPALDERLGQLPGAAPDLEDA